jgi:hypothetical protein
LAVATIAFALIFFAGGPIALHHIRRGGPWSKSKRRVKLGRLFPEDFVQLFAHSGVFEAKTSKPVPLKTTFHRRCVCGPALI